MTKRLTAAVLMQVCIPASRYAGMHVWWVTRIHVMRMRRFLQEQNSSHASRTSKPGCPRELQRADVLEEVNTRMPSSITCCSEFSK